MAINTLVGYSRLIHTNRSHSTPAYTFSEWDPEMFGDVDALQPVDHHWKFMVPWCRYNSHRCLTQVATDGNPHEIRTDLWLKSWEDWVDISGQRWKSRLPGNITQNPTTNFIQLVSIPLLADKMTTTGFKHPVAHVFQGWIPQHLHISWSISHCFPVSSNCGWVWKYATSRSIGSFSRHEKWL